MTEDPWRDIDAPGMADSVSARRVDALMPWNLFWARGADGSVCLTFRHARQSAPSNPLPRLRDIQISLSPPDEADTQLLVLRLRDPSQRGVFQTLCRDIISVTGWAATEAEAVSTALMRTWRWHHLLRGGSGDMLSPEEQKGLMGEMLALENILLPHISASAAVTAWRGPLGAPKDFEIGRVAVEVKARRSGATPHIAITSEDQLDEGGVVSLFLYVVQLDEAPDDTVDGVTVSESADRLQRQLFSLDPASVADFETLLSAAGLRPEDDYSRYRWLEGPGRLYHVRDNFPRILRGDLRPGISRVRYDVSLTDCEPFSVESATVAQLLEEMRGDRDGD